MGFWIYMLVIDILLPLTMIILGKYFTKKTPKEINAVFGYRTPMSMKNKDTWIFAHKYCGKIWFVSGIIILPITIIVMLFVFGKSQNIVGTLGAVLCCAQIVPLIVSVILTEIALKKRFNKFGMKK